MIYSMKMYNCTNMQIKLKYHIHKRYEKKDRIESHSKQNYELKHERNYEIQKKMH